MFRSIAAAAVLTWALGAGQAPAAPATLKMVPIDMDGGGGALFVTPEGTSLLIDAGVPDWGPGGKDGLDGARNGADRVVSAAKALGVSRIDYLITTHYHGDHVGGIFALLKLMPVGTLIDHGPNREIAPGDRRATGAIANYARYLEAIKGHPHIVARPGQVFRFGSLTATIVASDGHSLPKPLPGAGGPGPLCDTAPLAADGGVENAMSVASVLSFGKVRIANFGDLTWNREQDLVCPIDKLGHVAILLVSHHGLALSSNPASLAAMRPDIAVMSNGPTHGAAPATVAAIAASPGLQGFWKMHSALANPQLDGDPDYIANLGPSPGYGYTTRLDITRAGGVTVTNTRNGFRKVYQVK